MDALTMFVLISFHGLRPTSGGVLPESSENGFTELGEGECRQADMDMPLMFGTTYDDLNPWWDGDNPATVVSRCEAACAQQPWCLAVEVVKVSGAVWFAIPTCYLVTDRPTFEAYNGGGQDYTWGTERDIGGTTYQTYCGGLDDDGFEDCGPDNTFGSNWGGGKLSPYSGIWCYINDNPGLHPTLHPTAEPTPAPTPAPTVPGFTKLGEGECRQADGTYALQFDAPYHDLSPWWDGDNAARATARCEHACAQYAWCFAVEMVMTDGRNDGLNGAPECDLISDRPTFERYNPGPQDFSWGADIEIDGVTYQTYCGGEDRKGQFHECAPGNSYSSNFDGGKLLSRDGYWCYINNNPAPSPQPPLPPNPKPDGPPGNYGEDQPTVTATGGWTLRDGCTESRCSSKDRTTTQADAEACCDFFALPQSVKTEAIVADKAGWAVVAGKTWAEKLAWVTASEEQADNAEGL